MMPGGMSGCVYPDGCHGSARQLGGEGMRPSAPQFLVASLIIPPSLKTYAR